jgi:serine/threonine protein kinase
MLMPHSLRCFSSLSRGIVKSIRDDPVQPSSGRAYSADFRDLIEQCLQKDASRRPTAAAATRVLRGRREVLGGCTREATRPLLTDGAARQYGAMQSENRARVGVLNESDTRGTSSISMERVSHAGACAAVLLSFVSP